MTYSTAEAWHSDGKDVRDENGLRVATCTNDEDAALVARAPTMDGALRDFLFACDAAGFADPDADISGVEIINILDEQLPRLRAAVRGANP
jgi:hypothetical protein